MFKFFAVAFVAIIGANALTDDERARIIENHKECLTVSGVDLGVILKARRGEFVDDPKLKTHLFCMFKKAGFQNDRGEILRDPVRARLVTELKDEKTADQLIAKCSVQRATPEDTAFEVTKCFYSNSLNHISLAGGARQARQG